MNAHLLLPEGSPCHAIGNTIFTSLTILAFDALPGKLLRLGLDLRVEEINEFGLIVLSRVFDVVVREHTKELPNCERGWVEFWFQVVS